ncbi:hypothetical protein IW261DRAFT_1421117 [Armillaria novae-zelandiae]|uniref:DUF6532 domain-containing protein n=1 Tax=Armillaria novae-zelandiae TaxID=153914 RepID=A0AA39TB68_9AGAR|nr:hypothetical protein IW261DRAFT_1421117 [Armillaria novae-zelandiae]
MAKNRAQSTRTRYEDSDFDMNQTQEAGVAGISASETTSSEAPSRHATLNTTPITTSTRNATAPTQASSSNTPVDTSTTSAGPPDHCHLHHQYLPQQCKNFQAVKMLTPVPISQRPANQVTDRSQSNQARNLPLLEHAMVGNTTNLVSQMNSGPDSAPMTAAVARFSAHTRAQQSAPFEMIDPPNQVGPNLNLGSMYTNHGQPFASSGRNHAALQTIEDFLNDFPSHGDPDTTNLEPFHFPSHEMDDFIQANITGHGTLYGGTNFDMPFIDPLELGSRGHTNVGGNKSGHLMNTVTSSRSQAGMALDHDNNDVHGSESWHDVKLSDDLSQLSNDQDLDSDTGSTSMPYQTDTRKVRLTATTSSSDYQLKIISTSKPPSSKAKIKFTTSWEMIDKSNSQESSYMLAMAWDVACNHLDLDESEITNPTAQEENLFSEHSKPRNPSQERIDAAKAENRALVQFLKGDEDPMIFVYSIITSFFSDEKKILLETIAFVASAIECAIDEWSTGMHKTCTFTADTYSQDQDLCTELQEMLYDNACNTAGISEKDGLTSNATGGHGWVRTNDCFLWNQT